MAKKADTKTGYSLKDYSDYIGQISKSVGHAKSIVLMSQRDHELSSSSLLPCIYYLLDYQKESFRFVSAGSEFITGYSPSELMAMSTIDFFQKHIHPEDAAIYENQVFTNYISSAKIISNDKIQNCRFSLNFRFKRKDGVYIKVLQQSTILETNDQGYPIVSAGILVDITDYKSDDKMILSVTSFDAKTGFKTISSISYSSATNILTAREKEIIKHIALGHSTSEIANLLSISQYTVNAHRRNIYDKTSCKNLAELINFAITNGLI